MEEKIMLIVDQAADRQPLAAYLQAEYTVMQARGEAEAIEAIQKYADRLVMVLLDIRLPGMGKMEILQWMSNRPCQTIPVIVLSTDTSRQLEAFENGAWDFIAEPADAAVIRTRVDNALRRYDGVGHKLTRRLLQEAQMEIDNLVNSIPGGIAVYRFADHFETLYFSSGVAALSGHTREEYDCMMRRQPAENIVYEADRERLRDMVPEALRNGRDIDLTYRIYHKNGSLVWIHLNAVVISVDCGVPIIHAVLQSVSKQDQLYDLLVNQSQTAVCVSNVETYEILYLNTAATPIFDVQSENYNGKKCYEYIFGRQSPCSFCKTKEMDCTHFSERIFFHPINHRCYQLRGKLVDWCGIHAHVEYILDITDQNQAQVELRETQELLTAALHNTNVTVWEYDIFSQSIIQSFNFEDVHGFEPTLSDVPECLIRSGFVHPQSVEDFRALYRETAAGKEKAQRDVLLQNTNRTGYRWERITYIPVIGEDGQHRKSIGTSVDITEQRNLEESFREMESLRSEITNGIMLNISKDRVDAVYSKMESVQTLNDGNMTNFLKSASLRIPDQAQRAQYSAMFNRENLLYAYAISRMEQFVEVRCQYGENEYRILQLHIRLSKSPYTGDVIGYSYVVDVDEQRTVEAIMDQVALDHFEFILLINIAANTARMISNPSIENEMAPKYYPNYTEAIRTFCKHFVVKEQYERCLAQLSIEAITGGLQQNQSYVVMVSTRDRNGTVRNKRLSYSYLNESAGQVLVTAEDITELIQAEQEKNAKLADALEMAKKASASKSEFLSNMSHDMRTPMNAILGFSQMALEEHADQPAMEAYMKRINESGHYLLNLINDVLDMAKIENKKMDLKLEAVDAQTLFGGIVSSVKPLMEAKEIDFIFEPLHFINGKAAIVDKLHMQQIFINLLSNAAKFTPRGGRVECVIETLSFDGTHAKDRAIIRDSGCGMGREFLEKAFLPFEQERKNQAAGQCGTGLGLAIVKSLVDLMGGTIEIHSTEGIGTEVILNFTTELVDQSALQSPTGTVTPTEFDFTGRRMLLCEDHLLNREIAGKLLTRKGFLVDMAENGAEGVRMFENAACHHYDAVLMDIRMPVLDGLQAARAIRRLDRPDAATVPIVAMTANAFDDDIQKSMEADMNAHLSKPIEPEKLYETLHALLTAEANLD